MFLPEKNNQANEGILLELAQYLESLGKVPVSEACKYLYSVSPASRQILLKRRKRCGLTKHCPHLSLEGDPSGGV